MVFMATYLRTYEIIHQFELQFSKTRTKKNHNRVAMEKFTKSEIKNQSFYTCCRCSAHLYLHADIQDEDDELNGHDLNRDNLRNTKRISLNQYTVECYCGAYLGFLRPDRLHHFQHCESNSIKSYNIDDLNIAADNRQHNFFPVFTLYRKINK